MRLPWQRRADRLKADTAQAKKRLHDVRADWAHVRATVDATKRERQMNGWTATFEVLFSGRQGGGTQR